MQDAGTSVANQWTAGDPDTGTEPALSGPQLGLIVVGVLGASLSGPLMAAATSVPALAMSLWRTGLGAVAVAPRALTRYRLELLALSRRGLARSCFAGVMLAAHFATWTSSLKLTSVASATSLVCLQAAWVAVFSRLAGLPTARQVWLGLAVALGGVLVVSGVDLTVSARALAGEDSPLPAGRSRRSTPSWAAECVRRPARRRTPCSATPRAPSSCWWSASPPACTSSGSR